MGAPLPFHFKNVTQKVASIASKVEARIKAGSKDIFEIGGNESVSYEVTHSTTFSESIGFKMNYPPDHQGHPEDITKVVMRIWVLNPLKGRTKYCYWIPNDKKTQNPWCVAWSVDEILTQKEIAEGLDIDASAIPKHRL